MIALDSSSMIAFLCGDHGSDVTAVEAVLWLCQGVFPPVVVTELLSDPTIRVEIALLIRAVPWLEITHGYWERACELGARLLRCGLKARLTDTLIAQSCLDYDIALIARDRNFCHFAAYASLLLQ